MYTDTDYKTHGLISTGFHLPYNPNLIENARILRKNMTFEEKKLWKYYLKKFKYRVLRQRPIDHYIVDFYCAKLKLVIEIDGKQHFTKDGKMYDEERTNVLKSYDLKEIRFTNDEVRNQFEMVCKKIEEFIPSP